jgi:hypothetical protein
MRNATTIQLMDDNDAKSLERQREIVEMRRGVEAEDGEIGCK